MAIHNLFHYNLTHKTSNKKMNTGLTYFGRKHIHESLTSSFKNLFSRNLFGITNEYFGWYT